MAPAAEAKVSSVSCLSLITLAFLVHSTVSFLLPSVHVAPPAAALRTGVATPGMSAVSCLARTSASLCSARSTTTRCGLHGNTNIGLRRKLRNAGLSMATEPHVLRLQAAELGQRLKGTNVYFVGMMGTGKSTVARALAKIMGRYIFLDTDSIIEELLGATVGEVFDKDGEEAFRSVESQVLDQVHSYVKTCVATGGGIVKLAQNWGKLQTGIVVWLDMEPKDIVARMKKDPEQLEKRPLLKGADPEAKLEEILAERRSQYNQADVRVQLDASEDVDDATMNVINSVLEYIDSNPPKWQEWKEKANAAGIDWA